MRELTTSQAINEALVEELERDPRVFLIGEDIGLHGGAFAVTKGLFQRFGPKRIRNTPISEAVIAGSAVGAALVGARPVAELMYIDFLTLAMDQIVNQGAKVKYMFGGKARVPVVVRMPFGAGRANAAQHSQSLEAWLCHVPGLKVVMPSTPADAKGHS
jgi:pyruvate/2-oxoglutarate/acetoin dehydrogenase E1 component